MSRTFATHLAVLAVGMALGLGAVAVAQQQQPAARSASDAQIVRAINANSRKLDLVNRNLSGYAIIPGRRSVQEILDDICRNTAESVTQCF